MNWEENYFRGQQEGERILYVIRPHEIMLINGLIGNSLLAFLFMVAWLRGGPVLVEFFPWADPVVWMLIISCYLGSCAWLYKYWKRFRVFVTERRLVRFEPSFPVTESRRTLFWKDVLKTKSLSSSVIGRLLMIGSLEVVPSRGDDQGMRIPYVYYHEDIANYFDKIVYLTNAEPGQLKTVRPFVPAPPGERYPDLVDVHQLDEDVIEIPHSSVGSSSSGHIIVHNDSLKLPEGGSQMRSKAKFPGN